MPAQAPPARPMPPVPAPPPPRSGAMPSYADGMLSSRRCPTCGGRFPADFRVCPRDAVPLEDAPEGDDPLIGQVLAGSYEVTRVLGEGGMGRVYEARHTRLSGKRFAVKLLHPDLARQPEVVTRFQREAEAASGIQPRQRRGRPRREFDARRPAVHRRGAASGRGARRVPRTARQGAARRRGAHRVARCAARSPRRTRRASCIAT